MKYKKTRVTNAEQKIIIITAVVVYLFLPLYSNNNNSKIKCVR